MGAGSVPTRVWAAKQSGETPPRGSRITAPDPAIIVPAPRTVLHASRIVVRASRLIGRASRLIGRASRIIVRDSRLIGRTSRIIVLDSRLIGRDSRIIGRDSGLIGRDSRLIGRDSRLIGRDSRLIGRDSTIRRRRTAAEPVRNATGTPSGRPGAEKSRRRRTANPGGSGWTARRGRIFADLVAWSTNAVAAVRERRDRWLERINATPLIGCGRYDVSRAIDDATPLETTRLLPAA